MDYYNLYKKYKHKYKAQVAGSPNSLADLRKERGADSIQAHHERNKGCTKKHLELLSSCNHLGDRTSRSCLDAIRACPDSAEESTRLGGPEGDPYFRPRRRLGDPLPPPRPSGLKRQDAARPSKRSPQHREYLERVHELAGNLRNTARYNFEKENDRLDAASELLSDKEKYRSAQDEVSHASPWQADHDEGREYRTYTDGLGNTFGEDRPIRGRSTHRDRDHPRVSPVPALAPPQPPRKPGRLHRQWAGPRQNPAALRHSSSSSDDDDE